MDEIYVSEIISDFFLISKPFMIKRHDAVITLEPNHQWDVPDPMPGLDAVPCRR
jgi:hypothetical protein